jgi:hypothetical protein
MTDDEVLWERLVQLTLAAWEAEEALLQNAKAAVEMVRRGLHGSGVEVMTALGLLSRMKVGDRMALFPEILRLCLSQKFGLSARGLVLNFLPREWVKANIEAASRPLLEQGDHLDYTMFLGLYEQLDARLAARLAHEAAQSPDHDVREVGEGFLQGLGPRGGNDEHGETGIS